jgi:CheY-like chemotaxis protein
MSVSQTSSSPVSDERGVLIVDDEQIVLDVLGMFFREQGLPVWLAQSGAEAVQVYREHVPTIKVILLDLKMPDWDGPTTHARLKEVHHPFICYFISGEWDPYKEEELLALGATALLSKPIRIKDLEEIVRLHLCPPAA